MDVIETPAEVISNLTRLMARSEAGAQALYEQEVKLAGLERDYDRELALGLLNAADDLPEDVAKKLTAPEKVAISKLRASEAKFQLDLAKAEHTRIKTLLKSVEQQIMATGMIGNQIKLQWGNS